MIQQEAPEELSEFQKFKMKWALGIKPTISKQELRTITHQISEGLQLKSSMYTLEDEDPQQEFWNGKYRQSRVLGTMFALLHVSSVQNFNPPDTTRDYIINFSAKVIVFANLLVFLVSFLPRVSPKISYYGMLMLVAISLTGLFRYENRIDVQERTFHSLISFIFHLFSLFTGILILNTHFCDIRFSGVVVIVIYILFTIGIFKCFYILAETFQLEYEDHTNSFVAYFVLSCMQVYYRLQAVQQGYEYKEKINEQKKFKHVFDSLKEPVIIA